MYSKIYSEIALLKVSSSTSGHHSCSKHDELKLKEIESLKNNFDLNGLTSENFWG